MEFEFAAANLAQLQDYVKRIEQDRGFAEEGVLEKCLLLGEEVGELFKAVRGMSRIGVATDSSRRDVADELADVLVFLISIANRSNVDLSEALRTKEAANLTRVWIR